MPAPRGDADGAAQGADHRFLVRQLRRRGDAGARGRRRAAAEGQDRADEHRRGLPVRAGRRVHAEVAGRRSSLAAGEVGFVVAGIKELRAAKVGDTITRADRPRRRAAARLQGNQAAGVRRPLPGRIQPVRGDARGAREAAPERLVAALRAGGVAGARLRLPLRLPRPAAHGHRAGAPGARARPGADHHRAVGGLRGAAARRHGGAGRPTRPSCPIRRRSRRSASRSSRPPSSCRRSTSAR